MNKNFIEIKNLKHTYTDSNGNEIHALDDISLDIIEGEFIAIIGANGSGKSTLAKHLNALLIPSSGTCVVNGYSSAEDENIWNIRQSVGMVFQNPDNQIVAAIVEEDVAFGPENVGVAQNEIRKRVDEALASVNMTEYSHHAPHLLSGGQKQRVAIAGVMALLPKCIVMDEPTAMLDPKGRKEIVETVRVLNKQKNITIVYITHKMEEAMLANRIIVMNKGKIVMQGKPSEVFGKVEELKKYGLESPIASEVAESLRVAGHDLPRSIIKNEELAEALCL